MVQPTQDRMSDHLVACILGGKSQSGPFRDLLPNPLMRSSTVKVFYIGIEHALELLLLEDQQMVQAFLSDCAGYMGYLFVNQPFAPARFPIPLTLPC